MTATNQAKNAAQTATIDWDLIDGSNTDFEVQYPRMQWQHGAAKASGFMKAGGFFISKEQYPNFAGEGFAASTLITDDGVEIEGYAASKTQIAVIRLKHQWVKDEKYNRNVPLVHALVVVKGCDDLLCLSLRGATKSLEFQKAFNQHIAQNVSVANRTRPDGAKQLEPLALWFPVMSGASRKVSGKDSDKSSSVTPPELVTPESIDRNYVVSLWVGGDKYRQFVSHFKDTELWQKRPIWEKRDDAAHEPEFSGPSEHDHDEFENATEQQLDLLITGCSAKGLDVKELALLITNGETDHIQNLSRAEASSAIQKMKDAEKTA